MRPNEIPEPSHGQVDTAPLFLNDCTVLGGSGFPFTAGSSVIVGFLGASVSCKSGDQVASFSILEVLDVAVTGPGTVVTGGGFIGGGFGVVGALEGMVIAGILNSLTTQSKVHTFLTITTNFGELHLHYSYMEPGALRVYLADVFVQLRRADPRWARERAQIIAEQEAAGLISHEEAVVYMARICTPAIWPDPKAEQKALRAAEEKAFAEAAKGICPSCDKIIPLTSETCRYCKANFGEYASWKVLPLA